MVKLNRATGEVADNICQNGYPVTLSGNVDRLNGVLKFLPCFTLPGLDSLMASVCVSFINNNRILREAVVDANGVRAVAELEVGRNGIW